MMDLLCFELVLLLLLTVEIQASRQNYEVTAPTTWVNAVKANYKMATPEINYEPTDLAVNISYHVESKLWVGYYMAAKHFLYFGCIEDSRPSVSLTIEGNTPGLCYSACKGKQSIGLRGSECFCNVDVPSSTAFQAGCTKPCPGQFGIACGGDDLISIYKPRLNDWTSGSLDDGACLKADISSVVLRRWESCVKPFQRMCLCNDTSVERFIIDAEYMPWIQAMEKCFTNICHPALYMSAVSLQNENGNTYQLWTGIIRSKAIYKFSGFNNITSPLPNKYQYGYLISDNHYVYLRFQADNKMPVLVHTAQTSTTEIVPSSTFDKGRPTTDTFRAQSASDQVTTRTTDKQNRSHDDLMGTFVDNPSDGNQSEKDSSVILGVSVGVVSLITGVVVALVILKRRNMLPSLWKASALDTTGQGNTYSDIPLSDRTEQRSERNISNDVSNQMENEQDIDNDYSHPYSVVKRQNKISNNANSMYDTTVKAKKVEESGTYNFYNKLEAEDNPTYSHTSDNGQNGISSRDNTYDTMANAGIRLNAIANNHIDSVEMEEYPYNSTSKESRRYGTDNLYGIPSK